MSEVSCNSAGFSDPVILNPITTLTYLNFSTSFCNSSNEINDPLYKYNGTYELKNNELFLNLFKPGTGSLQFNGLVKFNLFLTQFAISFDYTLTCASSTNCGGYLSLIYLPSTNGKIAGSINQNTFQKINSIPSNTLYVLVFESINQIQVGYRGSGAFGDRYMIPLKNFTNPLTRSISLQFNYSIGVTISYSIPNTTPTPYFVPWKPFFTNYNFNPVEVGVIDISSTSTPGQVLQRNISNYAMEFYGLNASRLKYPTSIPTLRPTQPPTVIPTLKPTIQPTYNYNNDIELQVTLSIINATISTNVSVILLSISDQSIIRNTLSAVFHLPTPQIMVISSDNILRITASNQIFNEWVNPYTNLRSLQNSKNTKTALIITSNVYVTSSDYSNTSYTVSSTSKHVESLLSNAQSSNQLTILFQSNARNVTSSIFTKSVVESSAVTAFSPSYAPIYLITDDHYHHNSLIAEYIIIPVFGVFCLGMMLFAYWNRKAIKGCFIASPPEEIETPTAESIDPSIASSLSKKIEIKYFKWSELAIPMSHTYSLNEFRYDSDNNGISHRLTDSFSTLRSASSLRMPSLEHPGNISTHSEVTNLDDGVLESPRSIQQQDSFAPTRSHSTWFGFESRRPSQSSEISYRQPSQSSLRDSSLDFDGMTSKSIIIGTGSFGTVVKARLKKRNIVAVKMFTHHNTSHEGDLTYEDACEEAVKEFEIIQYAQSMLTTDLIVKVHGLVKGPLTGDFSGLLRVADGINAVGIIMRYESGGSLDNLLYPVSTSGKVSISLKERLRLIVSIALALSELHSVGIVHGDLKPGNILLSEHNPPIVRLADFGLSSLQDERLSFYRPSYLQSNRSSKMGLYRETSIGTRLLHSALAQTKTLRGTKLYAAPEMQFNPFEHFAIREDTMESRDSSEKSEHSIEIEVATVARPSRKTDMYAFALLSWEILVGKPPFSDIPNLDEAKIATTVHKNIRPSLRPLIKLEVPPSVQDVITLCWDGNREKRLPALTCYTILNQAYNVVSSKQYDIFFSHAWVSKPILSQVYLTLSKLGYRVWYDQNDMGYDLQQSMREGIMNSTVIVACINQAYQNSKNCMFELREANNATPVKPIVALVTEPHTDSIKSPFDWVNEELMERCEIRTKMYVDIGEICSETAWESSNGEPDIELLQQLSTLLEPLMKILEELGCQKSQKYALVYDL